MWPSGRVVAALRISPQLILVCDMRCDGTKTRSGWVDNVSLRLRHPACREEKTLNTTPAILRLDYTAQPPRGTAPFPSNLAYQVRLLVCLLYFVLPCLPASQRVQTIVLGSAAYLPAQQSLQLDLPWAFWNCPATHSVHGLFAPTTALKVPAAQRVHPDKAICPGDSLNLPL